MPMSISLYEFFFLFNNKKQLVLCWKTNKSLIFVAIGFCKLSGGRKLSGASVVCKPPADIDNRAPCLSQMKRFTSGRNSLGDFDWTVEISPVEHRDVRNYYSDEERGESDKEEEEVIIPFSAPMMMIGEGVALQPRKEINLWKRRTMTPPKPLELNTLVKAN